MGTQSESLPQWRVGVVGAGAVGGALLAALGVVGDTVRMAPVAVFSRTFDHAQAAAKRAPGCEAVSSLDALIERCDLIFIATSDDAIALVAGAALWRSGQVVAHLSGAHGVTPLAAAAARGAMTAALHPLMTFPRSLRDATAADILARMAGATWALECPDAEAARRLSALVTALAGRVIALTEADRAPYHLSGVLASNYVATLLGAASELWQGWGVERGDALRALLPLLRATVENLESVGLPDALTGPIARGDVGAVRIHEEWLRASPAAADLRAAYEALARLTVPLAREKRSLDDAGASAILRALDGE
ncbi:MAG TPA: DUF2520 domain-containing protein [Ktedonobacterales bacterium]